MLSLREKTHKDGLKGYDVRMSDGTTAQQEGQVSGKPQCLLSWCLLGARPEHPYLTRGVYIHVNLDMTPMAYGQWPMANGLAFEVWKYTQSNSFLDNPKKWLHIGNDENSPCLKSPWMQVFVAWNILISPQIHLGSY